MFVIVYSDLNFPVRIIVNDDGKPFTSEEEAYAKLKSEYVGPSYILMPVITHSDYIKELDKI